MQGKKKKIIAIILLIVALSFIGYLNLGRGNHYTGEVEANLVYHVSEVSGKILECPIQLGSEIKKGDVIAVIDSETQQYRIEQLKLKIKKAKLDSSSLKLGEGSAADNQYNQAKASYSGAEATEGKASKDYKNAQSLYQQDAISKKALDEAELNYKMAESALRAAEAQVEQAKNRALENAADIEIALMESQLEEQKKILNKYTITAACEGIVMSKSYSVGDLVQPGYDLADISSMIEKYAVIYYPKEDISDLVYNQEVKVICGEKTVKGIIKFIDVKAQYTPKDLQTSANRNRESTKVKLLLPEDCERNPGQQVEIVFE